MVDAVTGDDFLEPIGLLISAKIRLSEYGDPARSLADLDQAAELITDLQIGLGDRRPTSAS